MTRNKRGWLIPVLVVLALCLLSTAALGECDRHPNASVYFVRGVDYINEGDEDCHYTVYYSSPYCSICDEYAGTGGDIYREEYESHTFRNNVCTKCGYQRGGGSGNNNSGNNGGSHSSVDRDALQQRALQLNYSAIGCTARVVWGGNVRSEPNEYSTLYGKVYIDNSFEILDYHQTNKPTVWYQISYYGRIGWISASLVEVEGAYNNNSAWGNSYSDDNRSNYDSWSDDGDSSSDSWLIGRDCVVTVSSGRARHDAGQQYGIVEYVHKGDRFTIIDVKTASDGSTWYKIQVDYNNCWVSANIVTTN